MVYKLSLPFFFGCDGQKLLGSRWSKKLCWGRDDQKIFWGLNIVWCITIRHYCDVICNDHIYPQSAHTMTNWNVSHRVCQISDWATLWRTHILISTCPNFSPVKLASTAPDPSQHLSSVLTQRNRCDNLNSSVVKTGFEHWLYIALTCMYSAKVFWSIIGLRIQCKHNSMALSRYRMNGVITYFALTKTNQ